jgi:uncharacterized protein YndB with AHSA1/START domain
MSIAPIIQSIEVKVPPARAFELFTAQMSAWWPRGKTVGAQPHVAIVVEAKEGGRWFERDKAGYESQWGKVLAWEPPHRVLLGWQLNSQWSYDPAFLTEVELTFVALAAGGTGVILEHRQLERFARMPRPMPPNSRPAGPPASPILRNSPTIMREENRQSSFTVYRLPGDRRAKFYPSADPCGNVPVIEHGGFTLYETKAILRYLDRVVAASSIVPYDVRCAARMHPLMNIADEYLL